MIDILSFDRRVLKGYAFLKCFYVRSLFVYIEKRFFWFDVDRNMYCICETAVARIIYPDFEKIHVAYFKLKLSQIYKWIV